MAYTVVSLGPFEGLNQDENPLALRDGELRRAENIGRRGSMIGIRPGAAPLNGGEDYADQLANGPAIQGAYEYRSGFDQNRTLIVIADVATATRKIWFDDASQLPAGPTLTTDTDYIWSMTQHENLLWGAGGPAGREAVSTEPVWYWDGNTANAATDFTAAGFTDKGTGNSLRPKFITSWRNYLLVNGLQGGTSPSNNPAVTRYCDLLTDPTVDANWQDQFTIGFNPSRLGVNTYGRTYSTGFAEYQDNEGDFLLLLHNTHMAAVKLNTGTDFQVTDSIQPGCVHQRAAVSLGLDSGEMVYVSEHGIHSLRQSQQFGAKQDTYLSWKIRTFWNSLNRSRLPYTCGAYDHRNGRVVFAFSTGSEVEHDVLMCLDVKDMQDGLNSRTARWYGPWRLRDDGATATANDSGLIRVNHLEYMRDASGEWHLYIFTTRGYVLRFDEAAYQDLGQYGYTSVARTKDFDFGNTLTTKRLGDVMVTTAPGGDHRITLKTYYDFGRRSTSETVKIRGAGGSLVGTGAVGSAVVGSSFVVRSDKIHTRGRGRTIGFEFSHGSPGEGWYVGGVSAQIAGAGEDVGGVDS